MLSLVESGCGNWASTRRHIPHSEAGPLPAFTISDANSVPNMSAATAYCIYTFNIITLSPLTQSETLSSFNISSHCTANHLQHHVLILSSKQNIHRASWPDCRNRGHAPPHMRINSDHMNRYPITYGDRIYVSAIIDGRKVLEITLTDIADITTLLAEIRRTGRRLCGLARMFIRNYSQGWSILRPFRFYPDFPAPARRMPLAGQYDRSQRPAGRPVATTSRRPIFPWDTH